MTDTTLTLIVVVGIIFFLAGAVMGYLMKSSTGGKQAPKETPAPVEANGQEILRLLSPANGGAIIVQMDGQPFASVKNMSEIQQNRLTRITDLLRVWQGQPAAAAPANPPAQPAASQTQATEAPAPASLFTPAQTPPLQKRGLGGPVDIIAKALQSEVRKPETQSSIAAQVDEILQKKLETMNMKDRAIRLMELPGKGMVVLIGLNQYNDVSSVPDPEIRDLIRGCVAEWEKANWRA